jgi:hypothetical protein
MTDNPDLTIKIYIGTLAWKKIAQALKAELGQWYEYQQVVDWFSLEKANYTPVADRISNHYLLEFDNQDHKMEFVLKWL